MANKRERKIQTLTCSICGAKKRYPIEWWQGGGHNARPVNDGRCCDNCNYSVVIPARITKAMEAHRGEQANA